jgi:hypothetical protein
MKPQSQFHKAVSTFMAYAIALASGSANAQAAFRPATESEFVGYWVLHRIPDEKQITKIKNADMKGFTDTCQVIVNNADRSWMNLTYASGAGEEETRRRCANLKKGDVRKLIEITNVANPQYAKNFMWAPSSVPPIFFVINLSTKNQVIWAAHIATKDTTDYDAPGVAVQASYYDFKKGDLVLDRIIQMAPSQFSSVWRMALRPITEEGVSD